jgi:hypothetical protein
MIVTSRVAAVAPASPTCNVFSTTRHIIHSGQSCAESVEVDSGLASEGVHGSALFQEREGFRIRPLFPQGDLLRK